MSSLIESEIEALKQLLATMKNVKDVDYSRVKKMWELEQVCIKNLKEFEDEKAKEVVSRNDFFVKSLLKLINDKGEKKRKYM